MKRNYLFILAISFIAFSCLEKTDLALEERSFLRIYDNNLFSTGFEPLDIQQTPDGGYLILAERNDSASGYSKPYVLKVDKSGLILREVDNIGDQYAHPSPRLNAIQGSYYFFCLDENNVEGQLVKVNVDGSVEPASITPLGLSYPAVSSVDPQDASRMLLLSYDNGDREMQVSQVGTDGSVSTLFDFGIGDGNDFIDERITFHFNRQGRRYPFEIGRMDNGSIFYNAFADYSFALIFANTGDDGPTRAIYGTQANGGFGAVRYLGGNRFASSVFNFGNSYIVPTNTLGKGSVSTMISDRDGFAIPEFEANTDVRIAVVTSGQKKAVVFAGNTLTGQIALLFYNEADGKFIGSKYLGFSNPYSIGCLLQTSDGGMAICGTTYVAGRFPRICLFKLDKDEVNDLVN